jgi:hypothetical protein
VRNFQYLVYYDSWDGAHPRLFTPKNKPYVEFESSEQIQQTTCFATPRYGPTSHPWPAPPAWRRWSQWCSSTEETEQICAELGYELILPSDSLVSGLDSKIVTTRLGDEAGASVGAERAGRAESYSELIKLATDSGLGADLVVQTPYGRLRQDHVLHQRPRTNWDANAQT